MSVETNLKCLFPIQFTGGTPGTISGLTAANFPLNSYVAFYDGGSGVLPTGLSFNTLYIVSTSSSTVAQIAAASAPTTPLSFTGSGSGTVLADEKMTSTGQTVVGVTTCPATALPTATPILDTTSAPHALLGTQSACSAGVLTFQAVATVPGVSGDTIKWVQRLPAGIVANDTGGTNYSLNVIATGTKPTLTTGTCSWIWSGRRSDGRYVCCACLLRGNYHSISASNGSEWLGMYRAGFDDTGRCFDAGFIDGQ